MTDKEKKLIGDFLFEAESVAYNSYIHKKNRDKKTADIYLHWRTFFDIVFRTWRKFETKEL